MAITFVDTATLRQRGKHHEADAHEAVMTGHDDSPLPAGHSVGQAGEHPATAAAREGGTEAAQGGSSGGGGGSGSGTEAAQGGGGRRSEAAHVGGSGAGGSSREGDGHEGGQAHAQAAHDPHEHSLPGHLEHHAQHQAFQRASADAQDSEISRRAESLLPLELRAVVRHPEPHFDTSHAAQQARIAALAGAVPEWHKAPPGHEASAPAREAAPPVATASASLDDLLSRRRPVAPDFDPNAAAYSRHNTPSAWESALASERESRTESRSAWSAESALESGQVLLRESVAASTPTADIATRLASLPAPETESKMESVSESKSAHSPAPTQAPARVRDDGRER